jgi:hypothetical protein
MYCRLKFDFLTLILSTQNPHRMMPPVSPRLSKTKRNEALRLNTSWTPNFTSPLWSSPYIIHTRWCYWRKRSSTDLCRPKLDCSPLSFSKIQHRLREKASQDGLAFEIEYRIYSKTEGSTLTLSVIAQHPGHSSPRMKWRTKVYPKTSTTIAEIGLLSFSGICGSSIVKDPFQLELGNLGEIHP